MKKGSSGASGVRRSLRKSTYEGRPSAYSTSEGQNETSSGSEDGTAAAFILEEVVSRVGNPDLSAPDLGIKANVGGSSGETAGMAPNSRLKYGRFKGDGSQDVDDWLCEFVSIANANQETEESKLRMFKGVLRGEALKWFQDVPEGVRTDWEELTLLILRTFRETGGEAQALGRLSKMAMKPNEFFGSMDRE